MNIMGMFTEGPLREEEDIIPEHTQKTHIIIVVIMLLNLWGRNENLVFNGVISNR